MTKTIITISEENEELFKLALVRIGSVFDEHGLDVKASLTKAEKESGLNIGVFEFDSEWTAALDAAEAALRTVKGVVVNITTC